MPLIIPSNSITGGYEVDNSVRLNQGDHAHFSKTPSASNGTTFTYSFWVKRGRVDVNSFMIRMVASDNSEHDLVFESGGTIRIQDYIGVSGTNNWKYITNRLFRDPSAWYHILYVVDTNNGIASDRVQLYINGVRETSFSTAENPSSGDTSCLSKAEARGIGGQVGGSSNSFDGYMAEVVYVDGTAKSTTDFGEFDEDTGIWKPIDVSSMSLGSNGWYLDFKDSSSLGNDASGSNNWTSNNLTSIDQTTDTPTNNFATLNPLATIFYYPNSGSIAPLSEGNLFISATTSPLERDGLGTIGASSGKWYWEIEVVTKSGSSAWSYGLVSVDTGTAYRYYANNGNKYINGSASAYGATWDVGDIMGIAWDADAGTVTFYKNNVSQGVAFTGLSGTFLPLSAAFGGDNYTVRHNFGNPVSTISSGNSDANGYGNFEYAVPSGYYALCTKNLAEYG